jgi:hypothetical protein
MADNGDSTLRNLVGGGRSRVSRSAAMRARDVARPTEDDLAEAERTVVLRRRPGQSGAGTAPVPLPGRATPAGRTDAGGARRGRWPRPTAPDRPGTPDAPGAPGASGAAARGGQETTVDDGGDGSTPVRS